MSEDALWTNDQDELRRAFILSHIQWNPDIKTRSQIKDLDAVFQWLKFGKVPEKKRPSIIH